MKNFAGVLIRSCFVIALGINIAFAADGNNVDNFEIGYIIQQYHVNNAGEFSSAVNSITDLCSFYNNMSRKAIEYGNNDLARHYIDMATNAKGIEAEFHEKYQNYHLTPDNFAEISKDINRYLRDAAAEYKDGGNSSNGDGNDPVVVDGDGLSGGDVGSGGSDSGDSGSSNRVPSNVWFQ